MPLPVSLISMTAHRRRRARRDADLALALAAVADHVADGVRGVHDDVQHHLVEFAGEQCTERQVGVEIHLDFGDILPFVAGDT